MFLFALTGMSQNIINEINAESYNNYADSYNYTYWNDSWKSAISENRSLQTRQMIML
jgi:hypothetical protein